MSGTRALLLAATALQVVWGTGIDCSSCKGVKADPDTGQMHCRCDVTLKVFGLDEAGVLNVTASECDDTILIGGEWRGRVLEEQNATAGDVRLEDSPFCAGNVSLRLRDVFVSQAGVHFCPHIIVCNEYDINRDQDWCVTVHAENTCFRHRTCSGCLDEPGGDGCVWCGATATCLQRHTNPTQRRDRCGTCAGGAVLREHAWACPSEASQVPPPLCSSATERQTCTTSFCKWSADNLSCSALTRDDLPGLNGVWEAIKDVRLPSSSSSKGDGGSTGPWGQPPTTPYSFPPAPVARPVPSGDAGTIEWERIFGGRGKPPPPAGPNASRTWSPHYHFNFSKENPELPDRPAPVKAVRPTGVRSTPRSNERNKFVEDPAAMASASTYAVAVFVLVLLCSACACGMMVKRCVCVCVCVCVCDENVVIEPMLFKKGASAASFGERTQEDAAGANGLLRGIVRRR